MSAHMLQYWYDRRSTGWSRPRLGGHGEESGRTHTGVAPDDLRFSIELRNLWTIRRLPLQMLKYCEFKFLHETTIAFIYFEYALMFSSWSTNQDKMWFGTFYFFFGHFWGKNAPCSACVSIRQDEGQRPPATPTYAILCTHHQKIKRQIKQGVHISHPCLNLIYYGSVAQDQTLAEIEVLLHVDLSLSSSLSSEPAKWLCTSPLSLSTQLAHIAKRQCI